MYLRNVKGNYEVAAQLYKLQHSLRGIYSNILSSFEITLRNEIDRHYTQLFSCNNDWLQLLSRADAYNPFWSKELHSISPQVTNTCRYLERAKLDFTHTHSNAPPSHDDLVSSLSFGFWVSLFYTHQYVMLGDNLLSIFGCAQNKQLRQDFSRRLYRIKTIRNRAAHMKSLIFADDSISFCLLDECINDIFNFTAMMKKSQEIYADDITLYKTYRQRITELCPRKTQPPSNLNGGI